MNKRFKTDVCSTWKYITYKKAIEWSSEKKWNMHAQVNVLRNIFYTFKKNM